MNNSVYGKAINARFANNKKCEPYKNEFLEKETKKLFHKLLFCNVLIEKKTTKIKGLKNINLLHELPFYDELDIYKMSKAFRHYARSYEVEIVDSKGPLAQLEASKSSINDLSEEVLDEIKGFKYQITVKALLEQTQESVKRKWRHRSCSCLFQFYH